MANKAKNNTHKNPSSSSGKRDSRFDTKHSLLDKSTTIIIFAVSFLGLQDDAKADCFVNGSQFVCAGTSFRQGLTESGGTLSTSLSQANAGIYVRSGDINIHIQSGALITNNGVGASASSDAISNNNLGAGITSNLYVLNDGSIIASNLGGSNFAVELSIPSTPAPGTITFDNNGLIQGVFTAFSINATGLFTLNNFETGVVTSTDFTVNLNSTPGSLINNYGIIKVDKAPLGQFAIYATPFTDTLNLFKGSIIGGVSLREGDDFFNWYGGNLNGNLFMETGSDKALIATSNFDPNIVLSGGDDLSAADGFVDELTFAGTTTSIKGANLTDWEKVTVDGASVTAFDGSLTVGSEPGLGLTVTNGGALRTGTFTLNGNATLSSNGLFGFSPSAAGNITINGNVLNGGVLGVANDFVGNRIAVNGNYQGTGGLVSLDTALGNDASPTDMLLLNNGSSGTTNVKVVNVGGMGALTTAGIKIIDVIGASNGNFVLSGNTVYEGQQAVVGGAYAYRLYQGGIASPADGDWYLRSTLKKPTLHVNAIDLPLYQPGVPNYEAYPQFLLGLNGLPTLQQRIGNRYWRGTNTASSEANRNPADSGATGTFTETNGMWARIERTHTKIKPKTSTSDSSYDYDMSKLQTGFDAMLSESDSGKFVGGLSIHYVHGSADTTWRYGIGGYGSGDISTDGYGIGGTLTWYGGNGFYVDGSAQMTWYSSDLSANPGHSLKNGNDAFGHAFSVESGKRIAIDERWSVTPQAQLIYSKARFRGFNDVFDAPVNAGRDESLQGRLGISLERQVNRGYVYGIANLYNEFFDGTSVVVGDKTFVSSKDRLWAGIGLGGSYNWDKDKYSIYGEGTVNTNLAGNNSYGYGGTIGFRMKW